MGAEPVSDRAMAIFSRCVLVWVFGVLPSLGMAQAGPPTDAAAKPVAADPERKAGLSAEVSNALAARVSYRPTVAAVAPVAVPEKPRNEIPRVAGKLTERPPVFAEPEAGAQRSADAQPADYVSLPSPKERAERLLAEREARGSGDPSVAGYYTAWAWQTAAWLATGKEASYSPFPRPGYSLRK